MQQVVSIEQIRNAMPKLEPGIRLYTELQKTFVDCDPTTNLAFQKSFNRFYRVRRGAEWRKTYYSLMKEARTAPLSFEAVLGRLYQETGSVEASFASKLVATIDPGNPVIDEYVLRNLRLKLPYYKESNRIEKTSELYRVIRHRFDAALASPVGSQLSKEFENRFPWAKITPYKMLDLVLWQSRA